ncbi:hypothetical protein CHL78_016980 [Romboutsia weinsteinii]|uniref:Sodium:solute symporter family protein n=1 Tax=Romboutsia weinsteinii TaxID=2020949 RepID=A0A371IYX2_9FIRM|nr:hypothetical protein [Romboutsia weinsteinii]RDY25674.1 hypothetical protein CHL78_016980 [Romboutsia weinsteinii]
MNNVLTYSQEIFRIVSSISWPIFIPFLLLVGAYICIQVAFNLKSLVNTEYRLNLKSIIPRVSISLASIIGTGTIVGFLGALSKLSINGQIYVESIAIWALVGAVILIPISYCETLIAKVVNMSPKEYIRVFLSKGASKVYVVALILLYTFAIGGVQFSGIDAVMINILEYSGKINLIEIQRYLYIVIPIIGVVIAIVLKNKQDVFIKFLISMILIFIAAYFVVFGLFTYKTSSYIPLFIEKMIIGMKNPVSMLFGIPLGLIFGIQRIIQIAEPGLGTLALVKVGSDSNPRLAAMISLIITSILVVISIVVTSYIASYGINEGIIDFSQPGVLKLVSYFNTVESVTGWFGIIILFIFIILSALTTLLGGYLILNKLLENNKANNIIYATLLLCGGALAIFKVDMMSYILEILILIVTSLNITALVVFVEFELSKYRIKEREIKEVA